LPCDLARRVLPEACLRQVGGILPARVRHKSGGAIGEVSSAADQDHAGTRRKAVGQFIHQEERCDDVDCKGQLDAIDGALEPIDGLDSGVQHQTIDRSASATLDDVAHLARCGTDLAQVGEVDCHRCDRHGPVAQLRGHCVHCRTGTAQQHNVRTRRVLGDRAAGLQAEPTRGARHEHRGSSWSDVRICHDCMMRHDSY
jgi:hypothetical protein